MKVRESRPNPQSAKVGSADGEDVFLSVVIPAFNEEDVIANTVSTHESYFEEKEVEFELIVVNDGSSDETGARLAELASPRLRCLEHRQNLGKGAAVRTGALASRGDLILILDADGSTEVDAFERCLDAIRAGADVAMGSRRHDRTVIVRSQRRFKVVLGQFGNVLIRALLLPGLRDTQCGFKLAKSSCKGIFEVMTINGFGFDIEFLFLAKTVGLSIAEVPVRWTNRPDSRVKPFDYMRVLGDVVRVKLNHWLGKYDQLQSRHEQLRPHP